MRLLSNLSSKQASQSISKKYKKKEQSFINSAVLLQGLLTPTLAKLMQFRHKGLVEAHRFAVLEVDLQSTDLFRHLMVFGGFDVGHEVNAAQVRGIRWVRGVIAGSVLFTSGLKVEFDFGGLWVGWLLSVALDFASAPVVETRFIGVIHDCNKLYLNIPDSSASSLEVPLLNEGSTLGWKYSLTSESSFRTSSLQIFSISTPVFLMANTSLISLDSFSLISSTRPYNQAFNSLYQCASLPSTEFFMDFISFSALMSASLSDSETFNYSVVNCSYFFNLVSSDSASLQDCPLRIRASDIAWREEFSRISSQLRKLEVNCCSNCWRFLWLRCDTNLLMLSTTKLLISVNWLPSRLSSISLAYFLNTTG